MASPQVGQLAPDITLPSTLGRDITLSSFRGTSNVLLAFFPLAFSSTCTAELCAFSEDFDQFAGHDVVVLPLSVDSTYALKEYRSKYEMNLDLLSDFKRSAAEVYGVLIPEKLFAARSYFLIDKAGVLRWMHREEHNGLKRSNAEILAEIGKL